MGSVAMERLIRASAGKHGFILVGFDDPGLDERTIREFLAAIDYMLTEYPVFDLYSAEITEVDNGDIAVLRVESGHDGTGGKPVGSKPRGPAGPEK